MARLENLTNGSVVNGIVPNEQVTIVSTKWYSSNCVDVFYKTHTGLTGNLPLYRDDEAALSIVKKSLPWSFDVPGNQITVGFDINKLGVGVHFPLEMS